MLDDRLVADLAGEVHGPGKAGLKAINGLVSGPLVELGAEDVYCASMRLIGDELTSHFLRFRTKSLATVARSVVGKTMLFGHDKGDPGQGRFYMGETKTLEGRSLDQETKARMVFAGFYWPRARSDAEDLRVNLNTGVYHECSVSFQFGRPTCSICGNDIRDYEKCVHWPGRKYDVDGVEKLCFYWVDEFQMVLEGSIVYMGAHPHTGFGDLTMGLSESSPGWLCDLWKEKEGGGQSRNRRVVVRGGVESLQRVC